MDSSRQKQKNKPSLKVTCSNDAVISTSSPTILCHIKHMGVSATYSWSMRCMMIIIFIIWLKGMNVGPQRSQTNLLHCFYSKREQNCAYSSTLNQIIVSADTTWSAPSPYLTNGTTLRLDPVWHVLDLVDFIHLREQMQRVGIWFPVCSYCKYTSLKAKVPKRTRWVYGFRKNLIRK